MRQIPKKVIYFYVFAMHIYVSCCTFSDSIFIFYHKKSFHSKVRSSVQTTNSALHSTWFLQLLSFLLLSVTENHPAVQAMVLSALEEAKPVLTPPTEPISKILKSVTQEVCCLRHLFLSDTSI